MAFGLFGKLPQKRDFVANAIPGEILAPMETWLQSAVAASRSQLGRGWEETYLVAPIWRFWLGADIFGLNCAGALMPSVDGVGRYFPLMAIYMAEAGSSLPPPSYAPQEKWFAAIEQRLLSVLDEETEPSVETLLSGLPEPVLDKAVPKFDRAIFKGGPVWRAPPDTDTPSFLAETFEEDYREVVRQRSFWWAAGGEERGPVLHARNGLPDPYFHTSMLKVVTE